MNGSLKYVLTGLAIVSIIVGAALTFANKVDKSELEACVTKFEKQLSEKETQLRVELKESEGRQLKLIDKNQDEIKSNQSEIKEMIRMLLKRP